MSSAPALTIANLRRVHSDGEHNAFTDLCWFNGHIYLAFRNCPDGHMVHPTSRIRVWRSADGADWTETACFSVPDRDTRDPHFLVFRDGLFVYSGTWLVPEDGQTRDINDHLGYAIWTDDGLNWSQPASLEGTYGHYIWRAAEYRGRAYLCGRRKKDFIRTEAGPEGGRATEAAMLVSDDGLIWRYASRFREHYGDETAFLFEPDGSVLAVARTLSGGGNAMLCRSKPPYDSWQRTDLGRYVGGPMLAAWGARHLVGGRRIADGVSTTVLYWLEGDSLVEAAELPSGGDTSYTGFVPYSETHGLLSYYSSHESTRTHEAGIYLADLRLG